MIKPLMMFVLMEEKNNLAPEVEGWDPDAVEDEPSGESLSEDDD